MHSARQGDAAAQLELGRCYLAGAEGLGRNLPTAYRWLSAAADQGCETALRLIADEIPAAAIDQPERARIYLERAALAGSIRARTTLARWQLDGVFGPLEAEQIASCRASLRAAAAQGDVLAQLTVGALAMRSDRDSADLAWLEAAAERGEREACLRLIDHYWDLAGGDLWEPGQLPGHCRRPRDAAALAAAERALRWHETAWPEGGLFPAEELLRRGTLLFLNCRQETGRWLEKAAEAGDARAAYLLGLQYLGSDCMAAFFAEIPAKLSTSRQLRSYKQAESWLTRAAEQGLAEADFAVWQVNNTRNYSHKDPAKGNRHLLRAAQLGHPEACWQIARGLLAKDCSLEAICWLERAAQQGQQKAERQLAELAPRVEAPDEGLLGLSHALASRDPQLAIRLELAAHFALSEAEYLLIDPNSADLGNVLCVDIRQHYRKSRPRLIRIDTPRQRQALARARQLLGASGDSESIDYQRLKRRAQGQIARLWPSPAKRPAYFTPELIWGTSQYF